MMNIRRSEDRGHADHGWLYAKHSFSFSSYYDDRFIGFRDLRVINEDRVAGHEGFPNHSHKDMEIITYVLDGALQHRDSMGNGTVMKPGDVQYMSAGSGVNHSEFNHSQTEEVHLLQIWVLPEKRGETPTYDQKHFDQAARTNQLRLVVSHDGRDGSIKIRQDISLYASLLEPKKSLDLTVAKGRHVWVQVAKGEIKVNGEVLHEGDGVAISETEKLKFESTAPLSEFLVFDLN